ncbi:hypothetical protein [Clostridium botulinum]|uniref:hypothetical protein n=1 Tax=Clostridium botulinum TaxID=1491 RepID=UPI000773B028|nr:hypothetical protein [Clostridium botulinum]MBN3451381.1 hypothetical protein [Clostridium botulinum]
MELKDLVGNHKLSGFEYGTEKYKDILGGIDDREFIIFILNGIKYLASEDPDDGYRSVMNELEITDRKVSNIFKPIDVICKMRKSNDDDFETNDILEIYDKKIIN